MPDIKGQSPRTRGTPMPQVAAETRELANAPAYKRLTRSDLGVLLKLRRDGLTQAEIAQRLGCNQPTVSKWLAEFQDTTLDSKEYLRGQSLRMAQNIVKKGRAADHVAALKGLGVLEEKSQGGLTIVVGGQDGDSKLAILIQQQQQLSPPSVEVTSESVENP